MLLQRIGIIWTALAVTSLVPGIALCDEGMWTFDNFPVETVQKRYGATIKSAWLDKVRGSTVRLAGCTGSFVSADGLILTNHHCSLRCLDDLSTPQDNLLAKGFVSRSRESERKCSMQIADVLVVSENVTEKIAAATRGYNDKQANDMRKKALTQMEQDCEQASGNGQPLKCEAVTLYDGGQYFLYKYQRYTDVRLVFAPEAAIAAFGGDPDNFRFPRWCLDMSVLRAYVNGKPAKIEKFLPINFRGPSEGELVFVSGHPGTTERLLTVSQLLERRDVMLPDGLMRSSELRGRYIQFAKAGQEQTRITQDPLLLLENNIKIGRKQLDALHDEHLIALKKKQEKALRAASAGTEQDGNANDPWEDIERATRIDRTLNLRYTQLEGGTGFASQLFRYARALVRGTAERAKPNAERLREYSDTRLPRIQQQLQAATPIHPELEKLTLSFSLERMRELLGPDHPIVQMLLAKDSPDSVAAKLIDGSKLGDPKVRAALWQQDASAIAASTDPMIELVRAIDPEARAVRKLVEDEVEAPIRIATERIAAARFAAFGTRLYPDATFTLRLNFGSVQGWREGDRNEIAPIARLGRLFERAGADPFRIPDSWLAVRDQLDMQTPFNFSTSNDIVGGNSGSPLINTRGELVGLAFDGNMHSISGNVWFDPDKSRAIAVHPAIMRLALEKVYRADTLLQELTSKN